MNNENLLRIIDEKDQMINEAEQKLLIAVKALREIRDKYETDGLAGDTLNKLGY